MSPWGSQEQAKERACLRWHRKDPVGAELGLTVFLIDEEKDNNEGWGDLAVSIERLKRKLHAFAFTVYHFVHALTIVAQLMLSPSSKGKTSQLLVKVTIH